MASGSEQMSWQVWPHGKTCHTCGKTLRIQDVGEHRTIYEGGKAVARYLWCKEHRGGRNG